MKPKPLGPLGITKIRGTLASCPGANPGGNRRMVPYSEGVIVDRLIRDGVGEGAAACKSKKYRSAPGDSDGHATNLSCFTPLRLWSTVNVLTVQ